MLIKTKYSDTIIDTEEEPVLFYFKTDEERLLVAKHLTDMEPRPGSPRKYLIFPNGEDPKEMAEFMQDPIRVFPV